MNLRKHLHWLIYILFFTSCAKQTSPTGGPKDTIPPTLVRAIPKHETVNFKDKRIEMDFSEMVILNNPKEQIIITPQIDKQYEATVKKNKVILSLEKHLAENTTYTFNFRESIQDITEKNPVKNLQLAISTGSYIDSLSIQGIVYEMLSGKELKDITVAIQRNTDTLNIFKHPATYLTKSDEKGKFIITNLKPDSYFVYAFDDKNKNLIIDSKNEPYGFLSSPITLNNNVDKLAIGLVSLDARPLKVTAARPYNTYFNIRFSKGLKDFNIHASDSSDIFSSFAQDQSNIIVYNTIGIRDSLQIKLNALDSINNKIDTTLYVKFNKKEVTPEKFDFSITNKLLLADKGILKAELKFLKPVKELNFDSILFKIDSTTIIKFNKENVTYDPLTNKLTLEKKFDKNLIREETPSKATDKKDTTTQANVPIILNELYFGQAAFISVEQDTSRQQTQEIEPLREAQLGLIRTQAKTSAPNYIVQLVDKDSKPIQVSRNQASVKFEDLNPGEYQLRIILDKNANGTWDAGNFYNREDPEPIKFYKNEKGLKVINLKANWELGPLLITY